MNMNLDIWNGFEKTDPSHTKPFSRGGGFKGTAINGTYIVKKLTERFGPCGKGWKFVIEAETIHEGSTLKNGDKAKVHVIRGHIDYLLDQVWYSTSPQFGQTMFVDENKYGPFTDEEAPKKSITDCISKCAVMLGIGADVHLGLFDDNKYVNQRKQEEAAANGNGNGHDEPISEDQRDTILDLLSSSGRDVEKFCAYFKIRAVPELPARHYSRAIEALNTSLHSKPVKASYAN
jgi:hypothetical protein